MDASTVAGRAEVRLADLAGASRDLLLPALKESFRGVYRWHAKRTLRGPATVRAAYVGARVAGGALLERLGPEVGFVAYLFVEERLRGRGVGGRLLDDALGRFRIDRVVVAYASIERGNLPSFRLFRSRGFREVARKERGYRDGGLGAWGLRSKMHLVAGEVLVGRRLDVGEDHPNPATVQPPTLA